MRLDLVATAAVVTAVLAAGCAGTGIGDTSQGGGPDPASAPAETGGSAPDGGGDAGDASSEGAGPGLGNLSMEEADETRRNDTAVVFTWEGEIPQDRSVVEAGFDIPAGHPFTVTTELEWEGDHDLVLALTSAGTESLCNSAGRATGGPADPPAICTIPSFAQPEPTSWTVIVERGEYDLGRTAPFTVVVTVELDDPATVPAVPTLVEEPAERERDPGWPDPSEATIRPGVTVGGQLCTANFVFSSPRNASLYIGTASHCFKLGPSRLGEEVPVARGALTGTLAYCSWGAQEHLRACPDQRFGEPGYRDDFALVRVPDEHRDEVHPAMLVWGGPTGLAEPPEPGSTLYAYGNSGIRDQYQGANAGDARRGVVTHSNETVTVGHFTTPPAPGDSGSPVLAEDGNALGSLNTLSGRGDTPPGGGGVANLDRSLGLFEERTGRQVELATWPLFETPEPVVQD